MSRSEEPGPEREGAPADLREGVRSGILSAVSRDVERRGGRTARLLIAAGAIGIAGAAGITLSIGNHPFGHHPIWHAVVFTSIWSGLLVVCLAFVFLRIRTPTLPLARAAAIAIVGLGVAGFCGAICPDPHFLHWWERTHLGSRLVASGGSALAATCFGLSTTVFVGAVASALALGRALRPIDPLLPSAMLLILLAPGIALQTFDTSLTVFSGWLLGAALGGYLGVATGIRLRVRLARPGS